MTLICENGVTREMTAEEAAEEAARHTPGVEQLTVYAVAARNTAIAGGILFDGAPIPTDEKGRGFVAGAYAAAQASPELTKNWQISNDPITFVEFTNAQLLALGLAVDAMVQECFDVLCDLAPQLGDEVTTYAQIDAAFAGVNRVHTSA